MQLRWLPFFLPLLAFAAATGPIADATRRERPDLLRDFPEALAPVVDNPALPRVLLIGDSISLGYTPEVRRLLAGTANVHRVPDNGGPTSRGVVMLDEWLGDGKWDVIHFNFGLHDIARVNDGEPRATPEEYEANLRRITRQLKATGARLIFALTTPVPADLKSGPPRREADVLVYNEVARRVMQEEGVPLDDLHAVALPHLSVWQRPANVHYTPAGYAALAEPVAACIRARLPSEVSPK